MTTDKAQRLDQSNDMQAVLGTVDVDIPIETLWQCFTRANGWPRWNACMFWVHNRDVVLGQQLIWVFEPIRWWYLYKLPGIATLVEVEANRKVTWEISVLPGFTARHTYFMEDLGSGRSRFGSWEKAMGPTFRALKFFWLAHFVFVKDESLKGAQRLEQVYQRTGKLDEHSLPRRNHWPTAIALIVILNLALKLRSLLLRLGRRNNSLPLDK